MKGNSYTSSKTSSLEDRDVYIICISKIILESLKELGRPPKRLTQLHQSFYQYIYFDSLLYLYCKILTKSVILFNTNIFTRMILTDTYHVKFTKSKISHFICNETLNGLQLLLKIKFCDETYVKFQFQLHWNTTLIIYELDN